MDKLNALIHSRQSEIIERHYNECIDELWREIKNENCSKCDEPCDKIKHTALQLAMHCVKQKSFLN